MIIHHIEKHLQAKPVRAIDEPFERMRTAIGGIRRVRQHAIIAPIMPAGKIRDRHQLDGGNADRRQARQLRAHRVEPAEAARMQLVNHGFRPGPAAPFGILPGKILSGDQARPVHVISLPPRGRIRHLEFTVDPIAIGGADGCRQPGVIHAALVAPHLRRFAIHQQLDPLRLRRPEREFDIAGGGDERAKRPHHALRTVAPSSTSACAGTCTAPFGKIISSRSGSALSKSTSHGSS